jgi:aspartyl-tRNA(Asn)/glutamyl-tRNA(Gln) amidotransferase subunit B
MGWDEQRARTVEQRAKEESDDYRYFPEPDLPPLRISREWASQIQAAQPELPDAKQARFIAEHGLSPADATILAAERDVALFYEAAVAAGQLSGVGARSISNWITGELFRWLKSEDADIGQALISPQELVELVALVEKGTITANTGKAVMGEMLVTGRPAAEIVTEKGLAQVSDEDALEQIVDQILADNPEQVVRYQEGKETLLQWFLGQVMRATRGKANPGIASNLLEQKLKR